MRRRRVVRDGPGLNLATAVKGRVTAGPLPPLDIRAEAEALVAALRVRGAESGGALDLSEARARAGCLAELFATAWTRLAAARSSPQLDLALVRVLRPLHRIMFVPGSDHHPDPGIYGAPLPGLEPARILAEEPPDSDRYGFALAQLVRERARILEALARLIPPPRVHRHRYHGVLAPHARLKPLVVAIGREEALSEDTTDPSPTLDPVASAELPPPPAAREQPREQPPSAARIRWAQLLARLYEVLPLLCPARGGQMRILAFLTDPSTVEAILLHLDLPHRPPPSAPARGPPQAGPTLRVGAPPSTSR